MVPTNEQWDNSRNPFQRGRQSMPPEEPPHAHVQSQGQVPQSTDQAQRFDGQPAGQQVAGQQPGARPQPSVSGRQQPACQQQPGYYQQPAPQVVYAAPAQKKGHGWIVAIVIVVCLFALMAFCVKSCADVFMGTGSYGLETGGAGTDSVAVMDIDGTIQYDGTACSPEGFKSLLDKASEDGNVKALVLRVNSGGGTATAGEEMAEYLREFKEESGKPVVVSSASINASAAYEISSQADYVYVAKSTEIGSIGTAMELTDISGLLDMLGIDVDVITSADSKDSSYGYRPLTDEEREYYQHMIDQINEMFIENVAVGRSMEIDEVRKLATGLAFTGVDAVENGLADEIGTLEDAQDKAAELAGISDYESYSLGFLNYGLTSIYDLLSASEGESQLSWMRHLLRGSASSPQEVGALER